MVISNISAYEVWLTDAESPDKTVMFGYVLSPAALFDIPGHFSAFESLDANSPIVGCAVDRVGVWKLVPIVELDNPKLEKKVEAPKLPDEHDWDNAKRRDCDVCGAEGRYTLKDFSGDNRCHECWEDYPEEHHEPEPPKPVAPPTDECNHEWEAVPGGGYVCALCKVDRSNADVNQRGY